MISARKLAEIAGVSVMTVSRVLNNQPYVRDELRQRILELAEQYDCRPAYRPAPADVATDGAVIGCVMADISHFHYSRVVQGILTQAYAKSYHVVIRHTFNEVERFSLALEACIGQRMKGVIIGDSRVTLTKAMFMNLKSRNIPVVGMGNIPSEDPVDTIQVDEGQIGELMVNHLWNLGHRRIGYVGTFLTGGSEAERGHAIITALKRRGLSLIDSYEVTSDSIGQAIPFFFERSHPPTALIAYTDVYALQLMQQLQCRGLRVPKDISVLGCANSTPWAEQMLPRLSTIDQCPEEFGRQTVSLLIRRIAEGTPVWDYEPEVVKVGPKLIVRDSCAPARAS